MRAEDDPNLGTGNRAARPWTLLAGTAALVLTLGLLLAGGALAQEGDALVVSEDDETFDEIQAAIDAAQEGDTIYVLPGTYSSVTIDREDVTVCSSSTGASCDGSVDDTIIHTLGGPTPAVSIQADGVRVEGFFVNVAGPGTGIDASQDASDVEIVDNTVNVGAPEGTFGPQAATNPQERDYWLDAFVEDTLTSGVVDEIMHERADDDGFLGAIPVPAQDDEPAHVALLYKGQAPEGVVDETSAPDRPEIKLEENLTPETSMEIISEEDVQVGEPDDEHEGLSPGPVEGIGPGSFLLIDKPDVDEGFIAICTASYIFQDEDTGQAYLSTAGHCVLEGEDGNNQASTDDPTFDQENTTVEVCRQPLITTGAFFCSNGRVELGDVAWARKHADNDPSNQIGLDFGLVEIPDELLDEARPWMWLWGSPTSQDDGPGLGESTVHYGHGTGTGGTVATEGRAGLSLGSGGTGAYFGVYTSMGGDSGSGVATADARTDELLVGDAAFGTHTHGIVAVTGLGWGTTAERGVELAASDGGINLDLVLEDESLATPDPTEPPLAPIEVSALDASTTSDARIEVSWTLPDASDPAESYKVYDADTGGLVQDGVTDTFYVDASVTDGDQRCYEIVAVNEHGESDPSETDCATATLSDAEPIPAPTVNALDRETGEDVTLVWTEPELPRPESQEILGYEVAWGEDGELHTWATYVSDAENVETSPVIENPSIVENRFRTFLFDEGTDVVFQVRALVDDADLGEERYGEATQQSTLVTRNEPVWKQAQRTQDARSVTHAAGTIQTPSVPDLVDVGGDVTATPLIADLTGDGSNEVVIAQDAAATDTSVDVVAFSWTDGGFEEVWRDSIAQPDQTLESFSQPAIGDFDGDGDDEVAVLVNHLTDAVAGSANLAELYVLDGATGDRIVSDSDAVPIAYDEPLRVIQDGASSGDLLVAATNPGATEDAATRLAGFTLNGGLETVFEVDVSTTTMSAGPIVITDPAREDPTLALGVSNEVHVCEVDLDGADGSCTIAATLPDAVDGLSSGFLDATATSSIVAHARDTISVVLPGEGIVATAQPGEHLWNRPALGDVDWGQAQDGQWDRLGLDEVLGAAYNTFVDDLDQVGDLFIHQLRSGDLEEIGHYQRPGSADESSEVPHNPVLADVTGDGNLEILLADESGTLQAIDPWQVIDGDSRPTVEWQTDLGGSLEAPLALGDVTGDGALNVLAVTENGQLSVIDQITETPEELIGIDIGDTVNALVEDNRVQTHGDQTSSLGIVATGSGAPDSTVAGNTIEAAATGVYAGSGSDGMLVEDNQILMEPGWCDTTNLDLPDAEPGYEAVCTSPHVRGVQASAPITIRQNTIQATPVTVDTDDGTAQLTGTWGVNVLSEDVVIEDNAFTGWGVAGVIVWSSDADIRENTFSENSVGVHTSSDPGQTRLDKNAFDGNVFAVRLAGSSSPGAQEIQLRENAFRENLFALWLDNDQMHVDARLNDWGLYDADLLEYRIVGEGQENVVQQVPFLLEDGSPEPGLPTAAPASHSADASTCAGHPDADWTGSQCRFLTVQAAIDFSHADGTVVVPMSQDETAPTPYEEALQIEANSEGETLDGLTVCGSVVAMECAPVDEPARWGIYSDAEWGSPPVPHQGEAIRMDASSGDSTSLFTRDLVTGEGAPQVADLHGLGVDVLLESGDCPTHDPRLTLRVDTTGDGDSDTDYHVYPPESFECTQGEWTHIDYLESERWGSVPGTDQAGAHDELGPDHQILSMNLIWDGGSSSDIAWFDNQRYQDSFFREAGDDCDSADPSNCEGDARAEAQPRTNLDGSQSTEAVTLEADDVSLETLTVTWEGDADTYAAGVLLKGDGAALSNLDIKVQGGGCGLDADDLLSCYEPARTKGIYAPHKSDEGFDETVQIDGLLVEDSTIQGSLVDENGKIGASDGIRGDISNAVIQDNELSFWTANGVFLWGDNVTIEDNEFSSSINHVQVCDSTESLVAGNTMRTGQSPISITGCSGDGVPVLRDNQLGATNQEALWIKDNVHDLDLDARLNHWGAHGTDIIKQTRINDEGEDNNVQLKPYLDATGQATPPLPELRCKIDGAFTKIADALDIQDAVDHELPEDCSTDEPRQIILFDSEETYTSAVVDERVSLNTMSGTHTDANGLAFMQATAQAPALTFVEGSEESTVRGLTVEVPEDATGIQIEADGVTLEQHGGIDGANEAGRMVFLGDGTGLAATDATNLTITDALFKGLEDGIVADGGANLTVEDSLFLATTNGVAMTEIETADLERVTFFDAPSLPLVGTSTGVEASGGHNLTVHEGLFSNVDDALALAGTQDVNVTNTEITSATTGIQLDAYDTGDALQQPTGFNANNTDLASTVSPFTLTSDTANLTAEATCVNWGVYHATLIEQRIQDAGTNTTVTYQPWTSLDEDDPGAACLTPPSADFTLDIEHGDESPEDTITRLDNITFVDESQAGTRDLIEWRWDLGDGTQANRSITDGSKDIEHSYDEVETFPAMLTVEDVDGMTSREILDVEIENLDPGVEAVTAPSFAEDNTYDARIHHSEALTEDAPLLVTADDPEQDALSFEAFLVNETGNLTDLPGQAELVEREDYGEAELRFDPTPLQAELFEFEVNVTDAYDGYATETVRVDVWNDAPVLDGVPDLVAGAQDEEVSFTVHAYEQDPDELVAENITVDIDPTNGTDPFPEPIDDVFTISEHWEAEGMLIDFTWTPQNVDGEDSYEIEITADGPGLSTTETIPLEVREDMHPPILEVQDAPTDAPEGTTAQIIVDATVHPDAVLDPVDWEATAISITETDDGNQTGPVSDDLSADGNTVTWTGTMPEDVDRVEVTISADDGIGVVEITEEINVQLFPEMSVHMPLETSTGISTMQPVHGEPIQLSADASDADGVVEHVNATVIPHDEDLAESELALSFDGDDAWSLTLDPDTTLYSTVFPAPGVYDVSYVALDDDGLELLHNATITVQQLQAPEVTPSDEEKFYESDGPLGADISLSATSTDPNQRILEADDHQWYRIAGPGLDEGEEEHVGTGTTTSTTAPVGLHTYEIRVTDPYGEVGTATMDVYVWGFITADATLDNADAQRSADEYRYTGATVLENIEGTVTVLNDLEDGAESADVFLEATYHGAEGSGERMTYADAMVTTDETGQASFNLTQQLAGQLDGDSIASMPGYHEVTLEAVWEDTREHVPNEHDTVPDTYSATHTISFWVGPPGSQEAVETITG